MLKKFINKILLLIIHKNWGIPSDRISSPLITKLEENEIFVFGSNTDGMHTGGAAAMASEFFGAKYGVSEGITGNTYALPTIDFCNPYEIKDIENNVNKFIKYAKEHPHQIFLVTEIGCGIARWEIKKIAPLFNKAIFIKNIHLPYKFWLKLI